MPFSFPSTSDIPDLAVPQAVGPPRCLPACPPPLAELPAPQRPEKAVLASYAFRPFPLPGNLIYFEVHGIESLASANFYADRDSESRDWHTMNSPCLFRFRPFDGICGGNISMEHCARGKRSIGSALGGERPSAASEEPTRPIPTKSTIIMAWTVY